MLATLNSCAVLGVDGYLVRVEVDVSNAQMYSFTVVGLPDASVQESRERVRAALRNCGHKVPVGRLTVNLSPADIRKEGPAFDLPIALGLLAASDQLEPEQLRGFVVVGELSLDGHVQPVSGVLPMAVAARNEGARGMIVPAANAREAAIVRGLPVFPVATLPEAVALLKGGSTAAYEADPTDDALTTPAYEIDFSDVRGQDQAKRALEVAAAGAHNLLLLGPPGSGKTMLARRLATILPPLAFEEALEVTQVYSISGHLASGGGLVSCRPFRAPHHTVSDAGLIGGGQVPRPGEVSLAHHGVLFLDELPEFQRSVLEVLRQPLEDGRVTISRAAASLSYPARCMLVAAMNPCPCGYSGDSVRACTCRTEQIQRYQQRISGPLLDRIDIHIEVPRLKEDEMLTQRATGEPSSAIRARVVEARRRQQERFAGTGIGANAAMSSRQLRDFCPISPPVRDLLKAAINQLGLSARAYDRILKLARTIADLAASDDLHVPHVAEAIQYRTLDRKVWA